MHYPRHIAIIPDGCRRWAKKNGKLPWEGHRIGIETLEKIGTYSLSKFPIKYYTVYGLSVENLQRSKLQLKMLDILYSGHFLRLAKEKVIHENEVQINVFGRMDMLSKKLRDAANVAISATADYKKKFLRIALAYSGRLEIVDAVKKLISKKKPITEENISKNLYDNVPEPDFIIRTAETRLSNFLLWQGVYSELYFSKKYWPAFSKADYLRALKEFDRRKRRYGK